MGFMKRIQSAADDYANQQAAAGAEAIKAGLPEGTTVPRTDVVHISARFQGSTVEAYIATLGLASEDVYAVIPELSNDVNIAFRFVYRDRPEYEQGRAAWASGEA